MGGWADMQGLGAVCAQDGGSAVLETLAARCRLCWGHEAPGSPKGPLYREAEGQVAGLRCWPLHRPWPGPCGGGRWSPHSAGSGCDVQYPGNALSLPQAARPLSPYGREGELKHHPRFE